MEDALAQNTKAFEEFENAVLILVLMEDALAPHKNILVHQPSTVLILVLMEDALAQILHTKEKMVWVMS